MRRGSIHRGGAASPNTGEGGAKRKDDDGPLGGGSLRSANGKARRRPLGSNGARVASCREGRGALLKISGDHPEQEAGGGIWEPAGVESGRR